MSNVRLSKSQYVKGRKCLKRVWLYNHQRHLAAPPSEFQESIFRQGNEVGKLAQQLFPSGSLVHEDHKNPEGAVARTEKLLSSKCTAIFEAAFNFENILIRVDAINKRDDGSWDLFEVKSSTSLKGEHLYDAAIQKYVLQGIQFPLANVHILRLNSDYVRNGELDLTQLFYPEPVNAQIEEALSEAPLYLEQIRNAVAKNQEPEHPIGSVCKNPYPCEFKDYCWSHVKKGSVEFLTRISDSKRAELAKKRIEYIKDVPEDFELTPSQRIQLEVELSGKPHIDRTAIKKHLDALRFPLYFLDFETYGFAIPAYDGTWSYQQLPFQYSLDVQKQLGDQLDHYDFIHDEKSDPRRALAERLILEAGDSGSVVVYYAPFERTRIKELSEAFPDLAERLNSILGRIWDLEIPFSKRMYYDSRFDGSSSIKRVLPVLVPSMTYEDLEIAKGDVAQMQYLKMISLPHGEERTKIREDLLKYCSQDTLAMVKVLEFLNQL